MTGTVSDVRTAPRDPLTRERIVEVARRRIRESGHEQLTLRKLAAELGVTAPALYDHVSSKDDLLRLVAELGYQELADAATIHVDRAIERVRARCLAYVAFAAANPDLFRLMLNYRPAAVAIDVDNELGEASDAFELGLVDIEKAMADGDLAGDDAMHVGLTMWAAVHGVATVALIAPPVGAAVAEEVVDAMLAGLHPDGVGIRRSIGDGN